jgi:ABC-type uncharacterized transport system ATPase subunit
VLLRLHNLVATTPNIHPSMVVFTHKIERILKFAVKCTFCRAGVALMYI